jgi:hypothetical protein
MFWWYVITTAAGFGSAKAAQAAVKAKLDNDKGNDKKK